ncbi:hypothetical protein HZH68_001787 [Vespula germanica]|uniref:Uncharacterized protein n=1 Tax=Vespula germanica TaxID=30212 RepID=A0A834U726_VESGE|nr:hypothetical protein HZH68_001787 [Vespula germanica]
MFFPRSTTVSGSDPESTLRASSRNSILWDNVGSSSSFGAVERKREVDGEMETERDAEKETERDSSNLGLWCTKTRCTQRVALMVMAWA